MLPAIALERAPTGRMQLTAEQLIIHMPSRPVGRARV
jgi:hypothetical protein